MRKLYSIIVALLFFYGCSDSGGGDCETYYNVPEVGSIAKQQRHIVKMDSIVIGDEVETSFVGTFSIVDDTLYFADTYFGYLLRFNKNGQFIDKHIGKGAGPAEIRSPEYASMNKKGFFFKTKSNDIAFFNRQFQRMVYRQIDWQLKRPYKEALNNPHPEIDDAYEFDSGIPHAFSYWNKKYVAMAITASHPKFNGYFDSDSYYKNSRILALINLQTGKFERMIGRRPPFYLHHRNLPNFDHFNYQVTPKYAYWNFWADPNIYIYDKKEDKLIKKFGVAGKNMNTNYYQTTSFQAAENNWSKDLEEYGYYTFLKLLPNNMVARGYTHGENNKTAGLQFYKDYNLVGDFEVPFGLEVFGAIGNVYYATNTANEDFLVIYRITLSDK